MQKSRPVPKRRVYGLEFCESEDDPLQIELFFIKNGGYYFEGPIRYGFGKYFHYRRMMSLLWPDDDMHRWSDLILKRKCQHDILVLMGPADSNKTYASAKYVLCDYWAFPDKTLWMFSTTEERGAELRLWGKMKELWNRARELYPWMPGRVLDSRTCITTEELSPDLDQARTLTKGIVFIPCKSGENWVGLGCFPAGQMVDTPSGPKPIESINEGNSVISANGVQKVKRTSIRQAEYLVRLTLDDGRTIDCTPEHPFLIDSGWVWAIDIPAYAYLYSARDTVPNLQEKPSESPIPDEVLFREVPKGIMGKTVQRLREAFHSIRAACRISQSILCSVVEDETAGNPKTYPRRQGLGGACPKCQSKHFGKSEGETPAQRIDEANVAWIARTPKGRAIQRFLRHTKGGNHFARAVSESSTQLSNQNRAKFKTRQNPPPLPPGLSVAGYKTRRGDRRETPSPIPAEGKRLEAGCLLGGARLVNITLLNPDSDSRCDQSSKQYTVHNLEIDGHPSYSVNGILVHNSYAGIKPPKDGRLGHFGDEVSYMERSLLQAYANWFGKPNFQGILTGNPTEIDDPLCTAAMPVEGWEDWHDTKKTQEWTSRWYGAHVIAFDGRDSPNRDYPANLPARYPYMITAKKMAAVALAEGETSAIYFMQCVGKPIPGQAALRVFTVAECVEANAFDKVIWEGGPFLHILGLDAAYSGEGGDRCEVIYIKCGKAVGGRNVIEAHPPEIVPVDVTKAEPADIQIAKWVKRYGERLGVPPENLGFDGRATLALAFAAVWSPQVVAIDFNAQATDRPVSLQHFIEEEKDGHRIRRPKRCNEHYRKFVTELWFSIHYLLRGSQIRGLPRSIAEEGSRRRWKPVAGGLMEIETKQDMKARTNQSPDETDALVTAIELARRRGFTIDVETLSVAKEDDDWLEKAQAEWKRTVKSTEIKYS